MSKTGPNQIVSNRIFKRITIEYTNTNTNKMNLPGFCIASTIDDIPTITKKWILNEKINLRRKKVRIQQPKNEY